MSPATRIRPALLIAASAAALVLVGCAPPATEPSETPVQESHAPPAETQAETSPPETTESDAAEETPAPDAQGGTLEQCPDALAEAWLHLGTGDDVTAAEYGPRAIEAGLQPGGDAEVVCAVGLDDPEGAFSFALTVLRGEEVPAAVESAALAAGLTAQEGGRSGVIAEYANDDGTELHTLYEPGDQVVSMGGIDEPEGAYLLEGTRATAEP
ncbi:RAD23 family protein [Agrococcus baldri]|uniref:Lipoprotein n=1 Tax=Agrococcus baldri TaxID=153730 RepID=A0AA87URN9_9MICO|nr:hypothetical protein [Agrococcus baldri]GEK79665.1 hypothetical protein ABA31_10160 [Agrococcus baldri]